MSSLSQAEAQACECSICYDAIDLKTTGEVKLSCSHSFHFSCISSWFSNQEKGSCPCCRKEMGDKEDFAANAPVGEDEEDEEEEDEDDEDEEEDGDECVAFNRTQMNSLCLKFGIQRHISEEQWEAMSNAFACQNREFAMESWRLEFNFDELNVFFTTHCWKVLTDEQWIDILAAEETPLTAAFESARLDFGKPLQLPLQPFGLKERASFLASAGGAAETAAEALKVTWTLLENGSWTRTVFNPEEEMAAILSPALTAAAAAASAAEAATKVQAVWRGFSARVRQVLPRLRVTSVWM
jgi:hypothetical protein